MTKKRMTTQEAVNAINRCGILLVYPIDNQTQPPSLWTEFYPGSEMRWEWDTGGDARVANLWHMREVLSRSRKVVYAKWFKGRATFFSLDVFTDLLVVLGSRKTEKRLFTLEARSLLETLESDSPLSTKQLKIATDLRGKLHERAYEKGMKSLWERLLIVGFGELDDGAFPSLFAGASSVLFEDLWEEAAGREEDVAFARLEEKLGKDSEIWKFLTKLLEKIRKN